MMMVKVFCQLISLIQLPRLKNSPVMNLMMNVHHQLSRVQTVNDKKGRKIDDIEETIVTGTSLGFMIVIEVYKIYILNY